MCLFKEAELYCVSTKMRRMSELMQFDMGTSTSRYLPPRGTAGFERASVSGERRVPAPPPRITARMFGLFGDITAHHPDCLLDWERDEHRLKGPPFQARPAAKFSSRRHKKMSARGRTLKGAAARPLPTTTRGCR